MSKYLVNDTYTLMQAYEVFNSPAPAGYCASQKDSEDGWSGESYKVANNLAQSGDFPTLSKIDIEASRLSTRVQVGAVGYGRKRIRDYAGDTFDFGLFLSGEPRCAFDMIRTSKPNRLVRLIVNVSATWQLSSKALANRGAAICTLVRAIELKGYSTEITLVCPSDYAYITVILKKFGEYLNPSVIAFWLTSPSVLRRLFFRLLENYPMDIRDKIGATEYGGYGRVKNLTEEEIPNNAVYFPAMYGSDESKSVDNWYQYGKEVLEKKGVLIA